MPAIGSVNRGYILSSRYETQPESPGVVGSRGPRASRSNAGAQAQTPAASAGSDGLTFEVGTFIVSTAYRDLPEDVIELGKKSILDGLGLALCGSVAETGRLSRAYVSSLGLSNQGCAVIGSSLKAPPRFAAFVNGIGIHADDYDDTQLAVAEDRVYGLLTHPTAPVLSAALALGESRSISGRDLMTAYHVGVEVECKIAEAISPRHYEDGFHSTGTCGAIGAAAAAAKVCGLDRGQTLRALGIAASEAAGLRENFGTMTKPFHAGRAAESGVVAAELARLGWTAAEQILEAPRGFFQRGGRRLRSESDRPQARKPVDVSLARRLDQAASLRLADPSGHDRDAAPHSCGADRRSPGGAGRCRHESQYAERADSSPSEDRARGEVQHGILHGRVAALREGRAG